jgi:hypothetical protein
MTIEPVTCHTKVEITKRNIRVKELLICPSKGLALTYRKAAPLNEPVVEPHLFSLATKTSKIAG